MRPTPLLLLLAGCVAGCVAGPPDPRPDFSARNVGRTIVTFDEDVGTRALYLAPDGTLHLWSPARPSVRRGRWRYQPIVDEAAATYQATEGINYPAEELAAGWRLCFSFPEEAETGNGDRSCTPLDDYEALIVDRADGDALGLVAGKPPGPIAGPPLPGPMPAKRRLGVAALRAL